MKAATLMMRVDPLLKEQAEALCATLSTAYTMFLKAMVRTRAIPFPITADPFYSKKNQAYLAESIAELEAKERSTFPEPLKHNLQGWFSRRIDDENRLVYRIREKHHRDCPM